MALKILNRRAMWLLKSFKMLELRNCNEYRKYIGNIKSTKFGNFFSVSIIPIQYHTTLVHTLQ